MYKQLIRNPDLKSMILNNTVLAYIVMVLLFLGTSLVLNGFSSLNNIGNILRLASFLGIAAVGQTLVILAGGIDLSIGAVMTFTNIMVGQFILYNFSASAAIVSCLLLSILIGVINGIGKTILNIPPLIMTFAMGFILAGAQLVITGATPQGEIPSILISLSTRSILGIPYVTIIWVLIGILTSYLLQKTVFGRYVYAIGIHSKVARFSGINTMAMEIWLYTISAFTAGIAGLLLVGYSGAAFLSAGDHFTLETVAAVVIGGASILGGKGNYFGTFAGVIIFTIIAAALTVTNVSEAGKLIIQGILILVLLVVYRKSNTAS